MELDRTIAKDLLDIQAVFLKPEDPFTWASGIISPIYCDNRLVLSSPDARADVENGLAVLVQENFPEAEALMGTSTAGIAHAALTADILDLPMGYVRSGAKDHGRKNRIEGRLEPGEKVVVVEDLISTGGSVIEGVDALREAGAEVLGIVSIFTYGMQSSKDALAEAGVVNYSLTNFDVVVSVAAETGYIGAESVPKLLAFRDNPQDESWVHVKAEVKEAEPEGPADGDGADASEHKRAAEAESGAAADATAENETAEDTIAEDEAADKEE